MKKLILTIILSIFSYASTIEDSIVKIYTTSYKYDEFYANDNLIYNIGTGSIIEGNMILTLAHLVNHAKFIVVQKENNKNQFYIATVKYLSNQTDLALLEITDKTFYNDTKSLSISEDIKLFDRVVTYDTSKFDNNLYIGNAKIEKIDYTSYDLEPSSKYLIFQLDKIIDMKDSGTPVLNDKNEIIGITTQKTKTLTNVIPSIVIKAFLEDIKDSKVDGLYSSSTDYTTIKESFLEEFKNTNGVLITTVDIRDIELKPNDIILKINNKTIYKDGTIDSKYGRVNFTFELEYKNVGDIIQLEIIRNKKNFLVDYKIKYSKPIIAYESYIRAPFLNLGGLTFSPLSVNYLRKINLSEKKIALIVNNYRKTSDVTQIVVFNKDYKYDSITNYMITKVNGIEIKNFEQFKNVIDNVNDKYIEIEFSNQKKVRLNTKEAKSNKFGIKDIQWITN